MNFPSQGNFCHLFLTESEGNIEERTGKSGRFRRLVIRSDGVRLGRGINERDGRLRDVDFDHRRGAPEEGLAQREGSP
uniref:Uncharacterized protein n=1 Tax=Rhizophora mucronata TaxID=61149 RepID=A0A2P2IHU2_RHIMU